MVGPIGKPVVGGESHRLAGSFLFPNNLSTNMGGPSVKKIGIYLLSSAFIGIILPVLPAYFWIGPENLLRLLLFTHNFSAYWEFTAFNFFYEVFFLGDITLYIAGLATFLYLLNVVIAFGGLFLIRMLWRLLLAMSRY